MLLLIFAGKFLKVVVMKAIIYLIFSLFFITGLPAQRNTDANLIGDVKDAKTGEHVPFINVTINNTVIGTTTDRSGHYFLKNLPVGRYVVRVSGLGYVTVEQEVDLMANRTIELNFVVRETAMNLSEVVVSANRNETNRKEASVVVGVLNPTLFATTNSVCMAQGLNFQPGVRVENNCGTCGFTQVRINGLAGPYSQILIDSRPVFSALSGVYGLEQIPVNMIERVEVVRGGGSALYGSNAIAGTINIITKEALSNSFNAGYNLELMGGKSPDHAVDMNTSIVSEDNKTGMYLYGSYRNRAPFDYNLDGFSNIPMLKNQIIGMRSYYRLSSQSKLTLEYHNMSEFRRGGNRFDLQPHETEITEQLKHEINGGSLAYNWFSPSSKRKLNAYTSLQHVDRASYYGTDFNPDAYGSTQNLTSVTGAQFANRFDELLFMPAELTAGFEYQYDDLIDNAPGYNRNFTQTTRVLGLFAQNEWKNDKLNLLVGARIDKYNLLKNAVVSPRITTKYRFIDDLDWRATYSAGFRAPQAFDEDLHIDAVGGVVKLIEIAENLGPEYSHSFSSSLDYYFKLGDVEFNVLGEAFFTRINDVFILSETGRSSDGNIIVERRNGSGARVAGLNLEGKVAPNTKTQLQFGYTIQQSLYDEAEEWSDDPEVDPERRMLRTPNHYGYFTLTSTPVKPLTLSASGTFTGSMLAPHFAGFIVADRLVSTPSFFDLNLKGTYTFKFAGVDMQLSSGVKNVFNSFQKDLDRGPLRDAGYVYGPSLPRTFYLGVKFSNLSL
jgi:outer membrane receptor for ferrienterochelin and colicins